MFDITSVSSYNNVTNWLNKLKDKISMENIVICGNKVDIKDRKVKSKTIKRDILSMDIPSMYYDISAKSNYNIEKPFIYLLRKLTDNNNIEILETRISSILNKYINQDN